MNKQKKKQILKKPKKYKKNIKNYKKIQTDKHERAYTAH